MMASSCSSGLTPIPRAQADYEVVKELEKAIDEVKA